MAASTKGSFPTRLLVAVALAGGFPSQVAAQAGLVLEGRVVEAGTSSGIQNAVVAIGGLRAVLTTADGLFRFDAVETGEYEVRVTALGYATTTRRLTVYANTSLMIALQIAPLAIAPLTVRGIEMEGTVRDGKRSFGVADADVSTDEGGKTQTNSNGRFKVGVLDGAAVEVSVRAFGYLPLDSVVVAREDEQHTFVLTSDALFEAMVAHQVERLAARSRPQRAIGFRNLDRERLVRYAGRATIRDVLQSEYGYRLRGRIRCVVLDEVALHPDVDGPTLATMYPEDVERIEFLFFGNMLRLYTRRFLWELAGRGTKLRQPTYVQPPRGVPFCI